jgi:hypothetical protein
MALVEAQQGDDFSSSSWLPNRFPGERFLARIARVEFSLTSVPSAHRDRINETGEALLSDVRVILVAWRPSSSLTKAIDLPLLYVVHEKLEMPVLGANAISGQCYPVAPNGGPDGELPPYSFRVAFKSGGCSAFLELFQRMLQRARANDQNGAREETAEQQQQHDTEAQRPEEDNLLPAYIDPNDSTDVHLAQPPEDNTMPQAYPAGSATMQLYKRR